MVWYLGTCFCPVCDWEQLWYAASWTRQDLVDLKKNKVGGYEEKEEEGVSRGSDDV